jgi:hypothetical protein
MTAGIAESATVFTWLSAFRAKEFQLFAAGAAEFGIFFVLKLALWTLHLL